MHFFNLVVEFGSLQDFECVTEDIEYFIGFDFSMTRLNK